MKKYLCGARLCGSHTPVRLHASGTRNSAAKSTGYIKLFLVLALVLSPCLAHAYAGPGAGFAVLSSFWTIFVAFLYSFYALATWPIRQLLRLFRRRKAYGKAQVKRVVIVGFDGMDPILAKRFMDEGKLPHFTKLRDSGTFRPLRT